MKFLAFSSLSKVFFLAFMVKISQILLIQVCINFLKSGDIIGMRPGKVAKPSIRVNSRLGEGRGL